MKINEVEALVGITKKNIRFYEAEGLLAPRRNSENGYRDYGEAEVDALRRIKLLRKLGVPLEEIRQMQRGAHTVGDGMRRHLVTLERERQNLDAAARLCGALADCQERLGTLDAAALRRVFDNILSNAAKYSDGDLAVVLAPDGEVTFSNRASALSRVEAARLFDRFYTVDSARGSTGLGLSIAKLLTEKLHGTISADYENETLRICRAFPTEKQGGI